MAISLGKGSFKRFGLTSFQKKIIGDRVSDLCPLEKAFVHHTFWEDRQFEEVSYLMKVSKKKLYKIQESAFGKLRNELHNAFFCSQCSYKEAA